MLRPISDKLSDIEDRMGIRPSYRGSADSYYNILSRLERVCYREGASAPLQKKKLRLSLYRVERRLEGSITNKWYENKPTYDLDSVLNMRQAYFDIYIKLFNFQPEDGLYIPENVTFTEPFKREAYQRLRSKVLEQLKKKRRAYELANDATFCIRKRIQDDAVVLCIGDVHGSCRSLATVLHANADMFQNDTSWKLKPNHFIVFTGDLIDYALTGRHVVFMVFLLIHTNDDRVFLCNGNHEQPSVMAQRAGGKETRHKCGLLCVRTETYPEDHDYAPFNHIPHGLIFDYPNGETVFFSHGTLPFNTSNLPNKEGAFPMDDTNVLWSDYHAEGEIEESERGVDDAYSYPAQHALNYMSDHGIDHHVSGHQDLVNYGTPFRDGMSSWWVSLVNQSSNILSELQNGSEYDGKLYVLKPNVLCNGIDVTSHKIHVLSTALGSKRNDWLNGDAWMKIDVVADGGT